MRGGHRDVVRRRSIQLGKPGEFEVPKQKSPPQLRRLGGRHYLCKLLRRSWLFVKFTIQSVWSEIMSSEI